jgi:cobalamin biosynthesis Co2+ chelatase CbiK
MCVKMCIRFTCTVVQCMRVQTHTHNSKHHFRLYLHGGMRKLSIQYACTDQMLNSVQFHVCKMTVIHAFPETAQCISAPYRQSFLSRYWYLTYFYVYDKT